MTMRYCFMLLAAAVLSGCTRDIPMVNLGIDDTYFIARMQKLALHPALTGEGYEWYVDDLLVSRDRDFIFLAREEGLYRLRLKIVDTETPYDFSFSVSVLH